MGERERKRKEIKAREEKGKERKPRSSGGGKWEITYRRNRQSDHSSPAKAVCHYCLPLSAGACSTNHDWVCWQSHFSKINGGVELMIPRRPTCINFPTSKNLRFRGSVLMAVRGRQTVSFPRLAPLWALGDGTDCLFGIFLSSAIGNSLRRRAD